MVSSNNGINNTVGASISGVTNTLTVTNASNTASSAARETIIVGGATAADPTLNWNVSGVTNWEAGIDNSDSDKWKLSQGTALGTNDTIVAFTGGSVLKPRQPAFRAFLNINDNNVTGDGTVYTLGTNTALTIDFDQGSNFNTNGTFTAPVTGIYLFQATALLSMTGAVTGTGYGFVTTLRTYTSTVTRGGSEFDIGGGNFGLSNSVIAFMNAGDTCKYYVYAVGTTKTINISGGSGITWFGGVLLC